MNYRLVDLANINKNFIIFDGHKDLEKFLGKLIKFFRIDFKNDCELSNELYISLVLDFFKNDDINEYVYKAISDYFTYDIGIVFDINSYIKTNKEEDKDFIYCIEAKPVSLYFFIKNNYERSFKSMNRLPTSLLDIVFYAIKNIAVYDAVNLSSDINKYDEYFIEHIE